MHFQELELAPPAAVSRAVLAIVQKDQAVLSSIEEDKDPHRGIAYGYLVNGMRMLGTFKERQALPLLIDLANFEVPSGAPRSLDIKLQALLAIGDLDAQGDRQLLLRALRNQDYSVRKAAAQGLSKIEDPAVLTELEVAASQESSRDTSKQIQAMADDLRARMNAKLKTTPPNQVRSCNTRTQVVAGKTSCPTKIEDNRGKPVKRTVLRKGFRSPTARLLAGLAITLAVVAAFCFYALYQIAGLRDLQNQTIERNRKDSLQLLRTQNDLSALGLAMRDMLSGDESYPLYAYSAQFDRIRQDIADAIRIEGRLTSFVNSPARQAAFRRGLAQFWISTGQVFQLAREGREAQARALVENSLEPQEASLMTAVSRLLVENNETQQKTAARVGAIYDRVEGQIYWLFAAALAAIALTSLMLIRANRTIFRRMEHLSEQRSGLARKLITMQEEMFRSISRELHDEFGQMLTAVGAMLSRSRRQHCPPQLTGDLDEIRTIAQDALDKTRSLTQTLHPSILDDGGLEEAIDWYLSVFEKQTGIHVDLAKSGVSSGLGNELGEEIPIHVYRVMQESLNNLAKHSRSTVAWVRIRFSDDLLEVEIEDRGVGMPLASGPRLHGMGLVAMRERAELLGGKIEFLRPEDGGTLVRLRVPLDRSLPSRKSDRGAAVRVLTTEI